MRRSDTRFKKGVSGNEGAKWPPGQSGNPAGKSKRRAVFEEAFSEALITDGSPDEAARLLWAAARKGEAWAIQELCRRFAPQTQSLHLIYEGDTNELDYTKLTNEQIAQLDAMLATAGQPVPAGPGKSPAEPA